MCVYMRHKGIEILGYKDEKVNLSFFDPSRRVRMRV